MSAEVSFEPEAWNWYMSLSGDRHDKVEAHLKFVSKHPGGIGSIRAGKGYSTFCRIDDGKISGFRIDYGVTRAGVIIFRSRVLPTR